MKLLKLDPIYRNYLNFKRALKLGVDGNEILAGLTAYESNDYLTMMEDIRVEARFSAPIDPERFVLLYNRYIAALPVHPPLFDNLNPTVW